MITGIEGRCDHRGVVYRPVETRDELQDVVTTWQPLQAPVGLNCRPHANWSGELRDFGPGEQQDTRRRWFLVKAFDVQERDVISVETGPHAPLLLKVHSVNKLTRLQHPETVHHIEVNVDVWKGSLTEPEDGS